MIRRGAVGTGLAVLGGGLLLGGCESTQEKNLRAAQAAKGALAREKGVTVTRENPDVRVADTEVISDGTGTAVAVELRSSARDDQASVPVVFEVQDRAGKAIFANDAPGLARTLTSMPLLRAGESVWWVHDQVLNAQGEPEDAEAKVGPPTARVPARVPRLSISRLRLDEDPTGVFTRGRIENESKVDQVELTLYGVARRGGKVRAAGRAGVDRLAAGKAVNFKLFWIGDPRAARVEVAAPPVTLQQER